MPAPPTLNSNRVASNSGMPGDTTRDCACKVNTDHHELYAARLHFQSIWLEVCFTCIAMVIVHIVSSQIYELTIDQ